MEVPVFLMQKLTEQYGEQTAALICRGYAARRRTTLRVNTLKTDRTAVAAQLAQAGIAFTAAPFYEDAFILEGAGDADVRALPLYERGEIYLQNLSSMLPPLALGARPGENVLDMAAAPGGKTAQIAALTFGRAMITACERSAPRAERLRFNLARQGATCVTVLQTDARDLSDLFRFDRILLDAPCSGSGTFGEKSRGRFCEELLQRNVKAQRALLSKALHLLRPGGEMVYSTCSLLRSENEDIVLRAVGSGAAELVPLFPERFPGLPLLPCGAEGALLVRPDECYQGFFVAKLRKTSV